METYLFFLVLFVACMKEWVIQSHTGPKSSLLCNTSSLTKRWFYFTVKTARIWCNHKKNISRRQKVINEQLLIWMWLKSLMQRNSREGSRLKKQVVTLTCYTSNDLRHDNYYSTRLTWGWLYLLEMWMWGNPKRKLGNSLQISRRWNRQTSKGTGKNRNETRTQRW